MDQEIGARFDDVTAGRAYSLVDPVEAYEALSLDHVSLVIEKAVAAARRGLWVAGYVTYDAAPAFDAALVSRGLSGLPFSPTDAPAPLAWFGAFSSRRDEPPLRAQSGDASPVGVSPWTPAIERTAYDTAFSTIKHHIAAGDTYQVNLTFPLRAVCAERPEHFYQSLAASQGTAHACHMWHGGRHVVSVSPERFFWIADNRIVTRPMKGTRRRGRWPEEDDLRREELRLSEKDRAENVMIVDLMRNDLGRVAQFGSVSVDELFAVERYPTVWQMTSEVSARLREDVGLLDVFAALFPCGSVTGAPKARSMEIIAEVEAYPRGVYCGAVGVLPPGDGRDGASFQVAIRTAVIEDGVATYGVGGGVTWDSTVDGEYGEALAKALVLTRPRAVEGVFETIRWDGDWVWLDAHLARLQSSASFWSLGVSADEVRQTLDAVAESLNEPTRVRVTARATGSVEVDASLAPARFETGPVSDMAPVRVAIDPEPVDSGEPRLFHKTTDRAAYESRLRRHPDVEDVLLVNERGLVTESTIANVVFRFGDLWVTPPVADGLLPGVMRAQLLADGSVVEESVSVERAVTADAVALVNSVRGWRPAALLHPG